MNHIFKIEIVRDGRWWMIHIPEIDGLTQARRLSEAETMAREYIALAQNLPYDEIRIETASVRMEDPASGLPATVHELLAVARGIRNERTRAREIEAQALKQAQEYAALLSHSGIPVRDIAELLDVSPQRVSQLANDAGADLVIENKDGEKVRIEVKSRSAKTGRAVVATPKTGRTVVSEPKSSRTVVSRNGRTVAASTAKKGKGKSATPR